MCLLTLFSGIQPISSKCFHCKWVKSNKPQMWGDTLVPCTNVYKHIKGQRKNGLGLWSWPSVLITQWLIQREVEGPCPSPSRGKGPQILDQNRGHQPTGSTPVRQTLSILEAWLLLDEVGNDNTCKTLGVPRSDETFQLKMFLFKDWIRNYQQNMKMHTLWTTPSRIPQLFPWQLHQRINACNWNDHEKLFFYLVTLTFDLWPWSINLT